MNPFHFLKNKILDKLSSWGVVVTRQSAPGLRRQFKSFGKSYLAEPVGFFKNPQFVSIGDEVVIEANGWFEMSDSYQKSGQKFTPSLTIGDKTHIRGHVSIYCNHRVEIGRDVLIGRQVMITDHSHAYQDTSIAVQQQKVTEGVVQIGDGCFLGHGAIILPNVKIGKNSVIGAGAVVSCDIPDYAVAAGNPAKVVKLFNSDSGKWEVVSNIKSIKESLCDHISN